jgi:hypothetical protein
LPRLTACVRPCTACAGLMARTWTTTSQSNSMRIAAGRGALFDSPVAGLRHLQRFDIGGVESRALSTVGRTTDYERRSRKFCLSPKLFRFPYGVGCCRQFIHHCLNRSGYIITCKKVYRSDISSCLCDRIHARRGRLRLIQRIHADKISIFSSPIRDRTPRKFRGACQPALNFDPGSASNIDPRRRVVHGVHRGTRAS